MPCLVAVPPFIKLPSTLCLPCTLPPPLLCASLPVPVLRLLLLCLQEKVSYLRSQAEMELQAAQQRLAQLQQQAGADKQAFTLHLTAATQ